MSDVRLYVDTPLTGGEEVSLDKGQSHYLSNVMRRSEGDTVLLFNGRDGEWRAGIAAAGKKEVRLSLEEQIRPQPDEPDLWLMFALLKRGPVDLIAEKATELGATRLLPVITDRTNSDRINADRLAAIAREASEQCGRLSIPAIEEPRPLRQALDGWPDDRQIILMNETGAGKPIAEVMQVQAGTPGAIMIGPEGGFSPEELDALAKLDFVTSASMGRRLLRAETAAIAALTVWQAVAGDWIEKGYNIRHG